MKLSLRKKIIFLVLSFLLIVTIAAGTISTIELQRYYKQRILAQMETQLDEVDYLLQTLSPDFSNANDYDYFAAYAERSQHRLTLIDSAGIVIFDSNVPLPELSSLDNHINRPEVQMAVQQKIGHHERISTTLNSSMFYAARKNGSKGAANFIRLALPIDAINSALNTIRWKIILGGSIAVLLISIVSYFLAIRITYPIHQLAQEAQKIRGGDFNVRFTKSGSDELGSLAELLNDILAKLNSDVVRLKKLERMRTQFLGNVSHELRTPIFSVQGYLETLMQYPDAEPEKQKKFIKKAYRQAVRLNNLLTDLIDISRIESGEMKMTFHPFDVHNWLQKIIIEESETAGEQHVSIILANTTNNHVQVIGDRDRLKQVLHNLITNAVKYNTKNGKVKIGYVEKSRHVEIFVSDTGRGIEKEHVPHIFERFYRVDKERSREVGGTGLGLAIVKHIIEAHNSKVAVESEINIGSRFSFTLHKSMST